MRKQGVCDILTSVELRILLPVPVVRYITTSRVAFSLAAIARLCALACWEDLRGFPVEIGSFCCSAVRGEFRLLGFGSEVMMAAG